MTIAPLLGPSYEAEENSISKLKHPDNLGRLLDFSESTRQAKLIPF